MINYFKWVGIYLLIINIYFFVTFLSITSYGLNLYNTGRYSFVQNNGFKNYRSQHFRANIVLERGLPPAHRVLIYKHPNEPREYLWKTRWPEKSKIIQLRAEKYAMGQISSPDGHVELVTGLKVFPCTICQFMDFGYALVSYGKPLWRRHWNNRPELGKLLKVSANNAEMCPVKLQPPQDFVIGQVVDVSSFAGCSHVKVTGISRGRGFQGVIKRHGFHRGPETHGSKHHRRPGSIGASTTPGCVKPGKKMPGRMGGKRVTFRKMKVLGINPETSLMYVKGSVAGPKGSYVTVTSDVQPPLKKLLK